ncbi:lipoprotein [Betaproteobacteria bacterium]|nr:lipoprotein [Betaproteobacteria bacterium]GHU25019.1 lipoprotein [Betaproteobacteria bacterium]
MKHTWNFAACCAGLAACLLTPGVAAAQLAQVDEDEEVLNEPAWKETAYALPDAPREQTLRAFELSPPSANQYQIDLASLTLSADGVIRYVLVAKSRSGASSTTFEGLRCETGERRLYASLGNDGRWRPLKRGTWMPLGTVANNPRMALAVDYFCDDSTPARSREAIIDRFRGRIDHIDPVRGVVP